MYSKRPTFIVGFHGCDEVQRNEIVANHSEMKPSRNKYDWLGNGFYFWENNYERALSFAEEQKTRGKIKNPSVLGAYIDLGNCMDLLDSKYLKGLQHAYHQLEKSFILTKKVLPVNKSVSATPSDLLLRQLDCAVIEAYASLADTQFDSVRGVFWEGEAHALACGESAWRTRRALPVGPTLKAKTPINLYPKQIENLYL